MKKQNYPTVEMICLIIITCLYSTATWAGGNFQNIAINEVSYLGNAQEDWIELINRGNESINISGWQWCARFSYPTIQPSHIISGNADLILEPGEIIALSATIDLNNVSSDLALYTSGPFDQPLNMVDFVQWGTDSDVGRSDVARDKGIWLELQPNEYDFIPTAASGETLSWCQTESGGGFLTTSFDFSNTTPTQGLPNNNGICNVIFANGFEVN